jgi:hypothetical protein
MLTKILLVVSIVLLLLKFGLRDFLRHLFGDRLRELGRKLDRVVNITLVVIVVTYLVQLGIMMFSK